MEKLKVNDIIKTIKGAYNDNTIDLGAFCDYDATQYLGDTVNEISDFNIDIYTSELLEWVKDNYSYIEDALDEYGTPTDSHGKADFLRIIQQGQYLAYKEEIYNNLGDMLKVYILYHLDANGIIEITEEQDELIDELVEEWKDNDILGDFEDIKEKVLQNEED